MKKVVVLLALLLCISLIFFQVAESTNFSTKQTPTHLIRQKTTPGSMERILVGLRTPNNKIVIQPFNGKSSDFKAISLNRQPKRIILDTYEDDLWVVEDNSLNTYSLTTGKLINKTALPAEATSISAMEVGFGNTPFISDHKTQKLYAFNKGKWKVLASGPSLGKPTVLFRIYGTLFIGTEGDVRKLNLKTKEVSVVAKNTGHIKKVTLDHLGYLLMLTDKKDHILRLDLAGNQQQVKISLKNVSDIEYNPNTAQLLTINSKTNTIESLAYSEVIKPETVSAKPRLMNPFESNGYVLSGSEYLVHSIKSNPKPTQVLNVLQGFYPEKGVVYQGEIIPATANKKLIDCAEKSFKAFKQWIKNPPNELKEISAKGTPPLFWLMANDYSSIKQGLLKPQRQARLWYWKRNPSVIGRVTGYWKWEAVLTKDCKCEIPKDEDIKRFLKEYLSKSKK